MVVSVFVAFYKFDKTLDKRMNSMEKNQIEHTVVLKQLVNEVVELKGYEDRISQNEQDIALINLRCDMYHKEEN